jgi:hypothetical protein
MTWSSEFRAAISGDRPTPMYILEALKFGSSIDVAWAIGSHEATGASPLIDDQRSSVSGSEIRPREWTSATGGFTVGITGDPTAFLNYLARGQIVALRVGFPGWTPDQYQTVTLGQVANFRGYGRSFELECRDILGALASRIDTGVNLQPLFAALGTSTTLDAAYTVGDATITVDDTTGFERDSSGNYLLIMGASTPFFLTATGKTGTTFTGCSATGQYGTTAEDMASGSVKEGAVLVGHPIELAEKVLASTGTASANGDADTLPSSWAYGIPQRLIDDTDMDRFKAISQPSSGADDWTVLVTASQADGIAWLASVFGEGGYFLTVRQGALTCRCAIDPNATATPGTGTDHITDEDIVSIDAWEGWDSGYAQEFRTCVVTSASGSTQFSEALSSLPAESTITYDVSQFVRANETNIRVDLKNRLGPWCLRVPERLQLTLRGWRWAHLAAGDVVQFSSRMVSGRREVDAFGYVARRMLVVAVSPNWFGASTSLTLAVLPDFTGPTRPRSA